MTITFTLLGCGNSAGTPSIGGEWGLCDPSEPRNYRTRASAVVRSDKTSLLIDTGPDLREQSIRNGIKDVDAVLYTHAHSDHIAGIDELRVLRVRHKKLFPIWGMQETITELKDRFSYLFVERDSIYPEVLQANVIEPDRMCSEMTIGDISFVPFMQDHGTCKTLGFRFGNMAYSTDMRDLDQQALQTLIGIKTWVVDAAAYKMEVNKVHAGLKEVFALNEIVQAEKVYLTHMPSYMDYRTLLKELPPGYEPAYDGLSLEIT